jgi:hypothetical protein
MVGISAKAPVTTINDGALDNEPVPDGARVVEAGASR